MKSTIQAQIAEIDQDLKLLIFSEQYQDAMQMRKNYLNHCLEALENPMNNAEETALVKFIFGK
ncbi:hypothetical protein KAR91_59080 [Candidatus Pacearchaeota archaeon]|nr:hypothetical protein [Candidatus Pacearchaeota archaeon]